jgi:hypothetical protein
MDKYGKSASIPYAPAISENSLMYWIYLSFRPLPQRAKKRRKILPGAIPRHKHRSAAQGPSFIREMKDQAVGCAFLFCPFFVLENYL